MEDRDIRIAVIGAGWAGAVAALVLARNGTDVTVFEAAKVAGGRARRVEHDSREFDNGQHLLLGAYERCMAVINSLHSDPARALQRLPLGLHSAPGVAASLRMDAPRLPAPLHLLAAIVTANGLSPGDKWSTCLWARRWLNSHEPVPPGPTVAELVAELPEPVRTLLWDPLCVAALNTPSEAASAQVFVEVLRRAFTTTREASDLVVPLVDLSALLPEPALAEVRARGGKVRVGEPVLALRQAVTGVDLDLREGIERFDRVIVATGPQHLPRLFASEPAAADLAATFARLAYEPITTLHFEFAHTWPQPDPVRPMLMLDGAPGQWLFWRRQPGGQWRASVVISAHHRTGDEDELVRSTLRQLASSYQLPAPVWQQTVTEKRATYACTPAQTALLRTLPANIGAIHFAGDWCVPELPATLEAAVIAGERAAARVINRH